MPPAKPTGSSSAGALSDSTSPYALYSTIFTGVPSAWVTTRGEPTVSVETSSCSAPRLIANSTPASV